MADIVLSTLNAKFAHCAFGLRYLFANLGELQSRAEFVEFTINDPTLDVLDTLLARQPKIIGLGVYIWNIDQTTRLVGDLKRLCPELIIVLGGPEVSYEWDDQPIVAMADYVITGEGDLAFAQLCRSLLKEERPENKIVVADVPRLDDLVLPYDLYSDDDLAHRVIYVEASRGCPFTCEFCLSALDIPVRQFPLEPFLAAMQRLLDRGCRVFKFVDRTFNLNPRVSRAILQFFLDRWQPGLFLHFEMIPDRLPDALRELIVQFPPGALQFEVGVQTFNDDVAVLISRRQDNEQLAANFRFLREQTGVHIHADLIAGLPGEDLPSFAAGFDRLLALRPQEIQVGILKRLRGTPIIRHDTPEKMVYSPHAPYDVLRTGAMDVETLGHVRRFARVWDLLGNSGNFVVTLPLLWTRQGDEEIGERGGVSPPVVIQPAQNRGANAAPFAWSSMDSQARRDGAETEPSAFWSLWQLSDWLQEKLGRFGGIPLIKLAELFFEYLTVRRGWLAEEIAPLLLSDYQRGGRSDVPLFLRPFNSPESATDRSMRTEPHSRMARQARHVQNNAP